MGLFFASTSTPKKGRVKRTMSDANLAKLGCKACALKNDQTTEPYGEDRPRFYFLTGSPSASDAARGKVLTGEGGRLLKRVMSRSELNASRFNAISRCDTRHVKAVDKKKPAISCKSSVVADIEQSQPEIVIFLGYEALNWVFKGENYVDGWGGRIFPVQIGDHNCWGVVTQDPEFLLQKRQKNKYTKKLEASSMEISFENHWKIVRKFIRTAEEAEPVTEGFTDGVVCIAGRDESDVKKLRRALRALKDTSTGIDIETTSLDSYQPEEIIVTCSISDGEHTVAFSVNHPDSCAKYRRVANKLLKKWLYRSKKKIAHNLKFELEWLGRDYGEDLLLDTQWADTMGTAYVLDNRQRMLSLDQQIMMHFGFSLKGRSNIDLKKHNVLYYSIDDVLLYNGLDAKWTKRLYDRQQDLLPRDQEWVDWHTAETIVSLAAMQMQGVPINLDETAQHSIRLRKLIKEVEEETSKLPCLKRYQRKYRKPFSLTSNDDVGLMYEHILKRSEGKTKKGYSTDAASMKLMEDEPLTALVLAHRKHSKALSTYVVPIPDYMSPDGRIHCQYHATRTATSRLASSDPNFQNWPKRKGKEIRSQIQAPPGYCILSADYGQIEARIIGMVSEDKNYIKLMWENFDIHGHFAKIGAKKYPEVVGGKEFIHDKAALKKFRDKIKNGFTFPLVYGAGTNTVMRALGMPRELAQEMIDEFFEMFPGIKKWQEGVMTEYKRNFYVETLVGNRRVGPVGYNEILNTPIQGTASALVTFGMNNIRRKLRLPTIYQIHDDLGYLVKIEEADELVHKIIHAMVHLEELDWLTVPLCVEMEVGTRWDKMTAIGEYTTNNGWVDGPLSVPEIIASQNSA